jgi:hypothetical protein
MTKLLNMVTKDDNDDKERTMDQRTMMMKMKTTTMIMRMTKIRTRIMIIACIWMMTRVMTCVVF